MAKSLYDKLTDRKHAKASPDAQLATEQDNPSEETRMAVVPWTMARNDRS